MKQYSDGRKQREHYQRKEYLKRHPKVVDLFSGAGGLSLGAFRAGFNVCGTVELDPHSIATHGINFRNTFLINGDIAKLNGQFLKENAGVTNGDLAGIIGGPPCQGFSYIGRNDRDDPRNLLFVDFFRIVAEAVPKFFLAENVPGILSENNKKIRESALSYVERDYVVLPPMRICAKDYGAPTTRIRVFFIGYRLNEIETLNEENFKPPKKIETILVKDALQGLPVKIKPEWQSEKQSWRIVRNYKDNSFANRLHGFIPPGVGDPYAIERLRNERRVSGCFGTAHTEKVIKRFANIEQGKLDPISKCYRLDMKGFCPTLRAGTDSDRGSYQAVRPLHPTENRVITPREAARLQGFPDWFQFSPTKWHSFRQIGSSVSPILAEYLLSVIQKAL